MIQANELRLENYLEQGKIIELRKNACRVEYKSGKIRTALISYTDLKPIPLTEEILLNCGFVRFDRTDKEKGFLLDDKIKSKRIYIRTKVISENRISNHFITVFNYSECHTDEIQFIMSVDYLHELQNICFLLRKKELEINL